MITGTELKGSDRCVSTLGTAASKAADLGSAATEAAKIIAAAGASEAPVLTGRLAGSLRATSATAKNTGTITSPLVYAIPIHWGRPAHNIAPNPFLIRAADQTETDWTHAYEKELQRIVDGVHGA